MTTFYAAIKKDDNRVLNFDKVWHICCLLNNDEKEESKIEKKKSGLTVLERIHQVEPNLKTIMISAFGSESTRVRAKELGAYAFLDKPFNIERLAKVVKEALRKDKEKVIAL